MNRDQKAAAIAEIADHIRESEAVLAVDYQGISVPQAAELRAKLRESDATFKIVKNSLTERAADAAEAQELKALLRGPTALTFVRGDIATAAKSLADYGRATQLLPFKGGLMDGSALDVEQIRSLSRLPSREVLYGQLVGVVASPVSGLVRTLNALLSGLAVALGQVQGKKESGELPAGDPPPMPVVEDETAKAPAEAEAEADAETEAAEVAAEAAAEKPEASEPEPAESEPEAAEASTETSETEAEAPTADAVGEQAPDAQQAEPEQDKPANDDNQADASAEAQSEDAEANPTKED
jgi:large subunit ribosomal protein L10